MPADEKALLRAHIRSLKCAFSSEAKAREEASLCERFLSRRDVRLAHTLLLFWALPDEPDTRPLLRVLFPEKTIYLPAVTGAGTMELRRYEGPASLRRGAYGIEEPIGEQLSDYALLDVALIPGVAFTFDGLRLGRGGGYYDRLLARPDFRARTIGYCFSFQLVPTLPHARHDRPVDEIL